MTVFAVDLDVSFCSFVRLKLRELEFVKTTGNGSVGTVLWCNPIEKLRLEEWIGQNDLRSHVVRVHHHHFLDIAEIQSADRDGLDRVGA